MPELIPCEFYTVRYVPDVSREAFVNVAVVLRTDPAVPQKFVDVAFMKDLKPIEQLYPDSDVEVFFGLEKDIRGYVLSGATHNWLLHRMEDTFSNALQLSPAKSVLTQSPAAELARLADSLLGIPKLPKQVRSRATGRIAIRGEMQRVFREQGVWDLMLTDQSVARYTGGDPLRIDCLYRTDATVKLFQAVSLAKGESAVAKSLAYTFTRLRRGMREMDDTAAELTAITESELDGNDSDIRYAFQVLQDEGIRVAEVAQLPMIAEQARFDLRV